MVLLVDQVKVGGKAKGRAMAEVLVARNTKVAIKAKAMAEARDVVKAEAKDVVEAWAIEQISANAKN